jgi:sulfur carrier protein ThiS
MAVVKVGRVPGRIVEVNIDDGETTIEEALGLAELEVECGFSVRLNGDSVDLDEPLSDGDSVTIVKEVKGN